MSILAWIIIFSLLGGVLSAIAASGMLLFGASTRQRLIPHLVSFAIGAMLGAAFLALLPHALSATTAPGTGESTLSHVHQLVFGLSAQTIQAPPTLDIHELAFMVLLGILGFFLLEKMVLWRHCHSDHCVAHTPAGQDAGQHFHHEHLKSGQDKSRITLILVGDGIHNLVDGIAIAATFMIDIHLGVVTTIALAAHEIPQEIGDFAILLNSGMRRGRALFFNILASLTTVVGALIAYYSFSAAAVALPYVLAIAASSFIYIAIADLIPGLHERTEFRETVKQMFLILSGVVVIYLTHSSLH